MFTVHVETMPGLKLEFDASNCLKAARAVVGINKSTGAVVVEDLHEPLLHKFHLQQNGTYKEEQRHLLPENINRDCPKYLTDAGNVMLHNHDDSTTFLFDQDMKLLDSWQHQGYLIATLSGTRAAYAVEEGKEWYVEIRIQNEDVFQLKPDRSTWEDEYLSMCDDVRTEKLAVTYASIASFLDIFSRDGKTKQSFHTDSFYEYQCLCMQFLNSKKTLFRYSP